MGYDLQFGFQLTLGWALTLDFLVQFGNTILRLPERLLKKGDSVFGCFPWIHHGLDSLQGST
jgi:hypothetical protein